MIDHIAGVLTLLNVIILTWIGWDTAVLTPEEKERWNS